MLAISIRLVIYYLKHKTVPIISWKMFVPCGRAIDSILLLCNALISAWSPPPMPLLLNCTLWCAGSGWLLVVFGTRNSTRFSSSRSSVSSEVPSKSLTFPSIWIWSPSTTRASTCISTRHSPPHLTGSTSRRTAGWLRSKYTPSIARDVETFSSSKASFHRQCHW
jgi:hypothetical protein